MQGTSADVRTVLDHLQRNDAPAVARLCDWLRIKSISTDPAYRAECATAAEWVAAQLRECGFEMAVVPTGTPEAPGHPMVYGFSPACKQPRAQDQPHVLFYGHYDVQPVDPLELWESPPFEPVIRPAIRNGPGERVVARGAVDDKGQVMTFVEAMRAWKQAGAVAGGLPITVLIEGEEESGSVNLERFVRDHAQELGRCDFCLISDTGMLARGKPAITYGVRGIAYTEVVLHGPDRDLHSGLWGGRVANPITELVRALAQLHDEFRRVTIPGFYDKVQPITDTERKAWEKLGFDQHAALKEIGLSPLGDRGEVGYTALEREWARPTCEINGISGGYTGKGAKTVIGAHAMAKVSFRLVADQDPALITRAFFDWLDERTPPGCRWELTDLHGGPPATVATESPALQSAMRALNRASGVDAAMIKSGGSIPVAGMLKSVLGLETIFMGFGLDDDRVHSPNEKFELDCFRLGCKSHALLVDELRR